jgi:hypothetical protein
MRYTGPIFAIGLAASVDQLHSQRELLVSRDQRFGFLAKGGLVLGDLLQLHHLVAEHAVGIGQAAGRTADGFPSDEDALGQRETVEWLHGSAHARDAKGLEPVDQIVDRLPLMQRRLLHEADEGIGVLLREPCEIGPAASSEEDEKLLQPFPVILDLGFNVFRGQHGAQRGAEGCRGQ